MSVRPIDFNGMMQNTQEVSVTRTHEEQRPLIQQEIGTIVQENEIEESTRQVHEQDDTGSETALDPDSENSAGYQQRKKKGSKNKKKRARVSDGSVSVKGAHKSFEITI